MRANTDNAVRTTGTALWALIAMLVPQFAFGLSYDWIVLSPHAQQEGWSPLFTTAGMIAVIDSILAGAFAGLLIYQLFAAPLLPCLVAAIVIFLVVLVAHQRYQFVSWRRADRRQKVLFPSEAQRQEPGTALRMCGCQDVHDTPSTTPQQEGRKEAACSSDRAVPWPWPNCISNLRLEHLCPVHTHHPKPQLPFSLPSVCPQRFSLYFFPEAVLGNSTISDVARGKHRIEEEVPS